MKKSPLPLPFSLKNPWGFPRYGMPLRCSIPFAKGLIHDPESELALVDDDQGDCVAQWDVLSRWPDNSVRVALMNYAEAEIPARTTKNYSLQVRDASSSPAPPPSTIKLTEDKDTLVVDTGRLCWTFNKARFTLASSIRAYGREWISAEQPPDMTTVDTDGCEYHAADGKFHLFLEETGAYRVTVRLEGTYQNGDDRFFDYTLRLDFAAGSDQVLLRHHLRNRHAGREGRLLRGAFITGHIPAASRPIHRVLHTSRGPFTMQRAIEIPERVDLDIGPLVTTLRNGESLREKPEDICFSINEHNPFRSKLGDRRSCAPLVDFHNPGDSGLLIRFAMPAPNQEAPLHLGGDGEDFQISLFPENPETPYRFGEGMGKTRDILLHFHGDNLKADDLFHISDAIQYPGVISAGAEAWRLAEFADMHRTLRPQRNKYPMLESKIDLFRSASHAFLWPEAANWRDYGDEVGARGRCMQHGIIQYINNEEDYLYCCMIDAWRLGQPYGGLAMARHLMDIDYIDFSPDPARDGGVCPHAENHTDGEVYPSHQWCQGLLYFFLATGDREALRIAQRIGDCLCWWITGPRGYALRFSGRETAWPLLSLSALYEVTGKKRYREAALKVVDDLIDIREQRGRVEWEYPAGSGIYSDYMIAMTFNGIWDVWAATGEKRVLELWKEITEPVIARLADPDSWGYIHFRNWPIKCADLTVLARWYELTGETKYIELGKNGLRLIIAGCPDRDSQFQGFFAMWYRHIILFLKLADEHNMINDDHCTLVW